MQDGASAAAERNCTMYEHLLLETKGQIAILKINNPKSLNALNIATMTELNDCLAGIETNKDIRVVILTGEGTKAFVAGADIAEMAKLTAAEGRSMSLLGKKTFQRIETMPQVVIAAVNGYALGGGCELAMACDIRIAAENAVFGQPECGLGIIPGFGGTQRLARLVGKGIAKELIFTCSRIDAQEAYRIGLANKVVPQAELMDTCMAMAEKLLAQSSYAIAMAKACIETGSNTDLDSGLELESVSIGLTFSTHDKEEGMAAFLERRPANLTDF